MALAPDGPAEMRARHAAPASLRPVFSADGVSRVRLDNRIDSRTAASDGPRPVFALPGGSGRDAGDCAPRGTTRAYVGERAAELHEEIAPPH
ncbi:MAG: hypothetical protein SNJ76_02815, partial [Fimbriimonadaceae bacterium]